LKRDRKNEYDDGKYLRQSVPRHDETVPGVHQVDGCLERKCLQVDLARLTGIRSGLRIPQHSVPDGSGV